MPKGGSGRQRKKEAMTEQELKALLAAEISSAIGHATGDLAAQRAEAMDYYLSDLSTHLPAPEGRSQVVSSDVADTIESLMPAMMEIFAGGDEVARFNPVGQEDEEAAEQETDYINHVFYQECDGFLVLHDLIKDTLMQKNGVVKRWWEENDDYERETYKGLAADELALLLADPDVEAIEHTERPAEESYEVEPVEPGPDDQMAPPAAVSAIGSGLAGPQPGMAAPTAGPLHDVVIKRRCDYGKLHVQSVPPGEFLISKEAKSIATARYVGHKPRKTESDLISEGYPKAKVKKLPSWAPAESSEQRARRTTLDEAETDDSQNSAMRIVEIVESYIRCDWNGDGIAELRKVTSSADGSVILDNEEADEAPFSGAVAIRLPHRWIGRSVADLTIEIQKINTALTRQLLDNTYLVSNTRTEVPEAALGENTVDDLLTMRPGGLIRTKVGGMMREIQVPPIAQHLLPVIEYFNAQRETRTGVTRYNQGLDANSLNKTASGISQILSQAQMRMRLLARMIAETGVKDLMLGIHQLIQKHDRKKHVAKLRNKWITVDPAQWKTRTDMTISVALGSGSKQEMLVFLQNILGIQTKAIELQGGAEGPFVTMGNVYNTCKEITKNGGLRSVEPYFTDPTGKPPPAKPVDPKIEAERAKLQLKAQDDQRRAQFDQQKQQSDIAIERERLAMEQQAQREQAALDRMQAMAEMHIEEMKAQFSMALEQMKATAQIGIARERAASDAALKAARPEGGVQ